MLQRSLKRLLSTVIQPCCTKWKLSLTKMDHLNIEVLLSCALCRIFVNKALTCPCRVLNVWFVFIMSLSQSFLSAFPNTLARSGFTVIHTGQVLKLFF